MSKRVVGKIFFNTFMGCNHRGLLRAMLEAKEKPIEGMVYVFINRPFTKAKVLSSTLDVLGYVTLPGSGAGRSITPAHISKISEVFGGPGFNFSEVKNVKPPKEPATPSARPTERAPRRRIIRGRTIKGSEGVRHG